jgi:hypothetical protein
MDEALNFLSSTDEEAAQLRTDAERAEFRARSIKDAMFKFVEGTVAERQAIAGDSKEYKDAMAEYFDIDQRAETIKNRRATAELIVRAWQTVSSNRRQGGM